MQRFESSSAMHKWSLEQRRLGLTIAFVPTMGFLHEGHLALMHEGLKFADKLVVSIFVNPMQFNDASDLDNYPMDEAGDLATIKALGCDAVFFPPVSEIYPADYATTVTVSGLQDNLCGASRPGHFDGVSTVCVKLFNIVSPDFAIFGKKDYQQLAIIKRVVKDLNIPLKVLGLDTFRESDGLAMSSRNARLSESERAESKALFEALQMVKQAVIAGEQDVPALLNIAKNHLEQNVSLGKIVYIEIVDADNLQKISKIKRAAVMALAVQFEHSRLIDNIVIDNIALDIHET